MGSLDSEQVFLKWNNFGNNLASGFVDLLQEEAMVDVTLAVEGRLVQAHKIVLSISSSYFKNIFQVNPCQHPVVILKDVGYQELTDMLDFMYRGEANVKQQDLPSFLRLAKTLKIKGLAGGCSEMPLDTSFQTECTRKESSIQNIKSCNTSECSEGYRDVTIEKEIPVIRKKRKRSNSPIKSLNFKSKCRNNRYETADAYDNDSSSKFSYPNEFECVDIKEERLSDVSYENCSEDIARQEMPDIKLLPGSSKRDGPTEIVPKESVISRRTSKPLSFIWSFFNFDCHKNKSECKLCGKVFKACPKTGIASVKYHLHFAHQILRSDGVIQ